MGDNGSNILSIVILSVLLSTAINYIMLTNPQIQEQIGITGIQDPVGSSGIRNPDYDSGWRPIGAGESLLLDHGLGAMDNLFVYMIGGYPESVYGQYYYGLTLALEDNEAGCAWSIDETTVYIRRGANDPDWEQVRVYIWKIPQ